MPLPVKITNGLGVLEHWGTGVLEKEKKEQEEQSQLKFRISKFEFRNVDSLLHALCPLPETCSAVKAIVARRT